MFRAGSSVKEQLGALEQALGLDWDDQDWGIVNADPRRVQEFVSFFEQHHDPTWSPWTVAEFVDLVMESACEALRSDPLFPVSSIEPFVTRAARLAPQALEYWTSRPWAVTPYLNSLGY